MRALSHQTKEEHGHQETHQGADKSAVQETNEERLLIMNQTMLYKCPGPHEIHGGQFDYSIVDADEKGTIEAAQADGWHMTTIEAKAAREAELIAAAEAKEAEAERLAKLALDDTNKPPTRAELEQMATSLSLPFTARTGDKKLAELIAAASATTDA